MRRMAGVPLSPWMSKIVAGAMKGVVGLMVESGFGMWMDGVMNIYEMKVGSVMDLNM